MKTLPASASINRAEFARDYRHVRVDPDTTLADVTKPGFWAHHASRMNIHDIIDVVSVDGSLDAQLRVVGIGIGLVEVRVLRAWQSEELSAAADPASEEGAEVPDGYKVNHAPKHGWRVLLTGFPEPVSRNHKSRLEATLAAITHAAKANGAAA